MSVVRVLEHTQARYGTTEQMERKLCILWTEHWFLLSVEELMT